MSDTPETDAEIYRATPWSTQEIVRAEFARKLERERDRARKLADEFHQDQTRLILELKTK